MARVYPNSEAFYADNEARRRSPEADYGCWWMDHSPRGGHWRLSYVQATGEVYAVKLAGGGEVKLLGVVPPDPVERTPGGNITSRLTYYRTLDQVLAGWPEHCGRPGGLEWIRQKLAESEEFRQCDGST